MISLLDINIEKLKNISKMTLDDLRNPEVFSRLKELAEEIDIHGLLKEANYLLEYLVGLLDRNKEFTQSEPRLFKDYQSLIIYLKFFTLLSQPVSEIENLFRKNLFLGMQKKVDLKERLRLIFLVTADDDTGSNIRQEVIKSMEANEEKIGKENLAGQADRLPIYPYIKNWLRDYNAFFPAEKEIRGELEQATYLSQNKNVKKLNQEEKEILTEIIKLYDYLRFSEEEKTEVRATGHTPAIIPRPPKIEGINEVGNLAKPAAAVNQTRGVGAGRPNNDLAELKELAVKYPPGSLERKAVEEEIKRLES